MRYRKNAATASEPDHWHADNRPLEHLEGIQLGFKPRSSVLSIITGGGKWVEITIPIPLLHRSAQRPIARRYRQFDSLTHHLPRRTSPSRTCSNHRRLGSGGPPHALRHRTDHRHANTNKYPANHHAYLRGLAGGVVDRGDSVAHPGHSKTRSSPVSKRLLTLFACI
jgi:hypothetical protein